MGEEATQNALDRSLVARANEILQQRAESLALEALSEETIGSMGVLLFRLGEEWYAVRVDDVREIYHEYSITPMPGVPDFILGVVSIRGEIVSVTDLARMMGLGQVSKGEAVPPAIVIQNDECATSIVVDEIGDIADVPAGSVEPPLSIIDRQHAEFIAGSLHLGERLVGLMNVERILAPIGASD
ncbi:MAG: chemotaxis protein CheW [Actinomycetota bacterium]|nr:chemotaxis protein CheW [Actinomycetota bacterium]